MAQGIEVDWKLLAEAIQNASGNISVAARNLGIDRSTFYGHIKKNRELASILHSTRESMTDNVESVLYKKALEGEAWAVCFYLKSRAKKRGYGETKNEEQEPLSGAVIYVRTVDPQPGSTEPIRITRGEE